MKKKINKFSLGVLIIIIIINIILLLSSGCEKSFTDPSINIMLTDAPATAFEQVNVNLKSVRILYDDTSIGWVTIPTFSGIYDLQVLNNLTRTVATVGSIPVGSIKEFQILFGNGNTVVSHGTSYPLIVPNSTETDLLVFLNTSLVENQKLSVTMDFDVDKSVVLEDDGTYVLNPVVTIKNISYN
jgi:hypothetical protein